MQRTNTTESLAKTTRISYISADLDINGSLCVSSHLNCCHIMALGHTWPTFQSLASIRGNCCWRQGRQVRLSTIIGHQGDKQLKGRRRTEGMYAAGWKDDCDFCASGVVIIRRWKSTLMRRTRRSRGLHRFVRTVDDARAAYSFAFQTGTKAPGARRRASSAPHRLMTLFRCPWPRAFHTTSGVRNTKTMPIQMRKEIPRV